MKNLLCKELRLATPLLTFLFLGFTAMTFIPGYPILCGAFFVCFGIFQSYQNGRTDNDILYTVLLPVKKSHVVKAKYAAAAAVELAKQWRTDKALRQLEALLAELARRKENEVLFITSPRWSRLDKETRALLAEHTARVGNSFAFKSASSGFIDLVFVQVFFRDQRGNVVKK